MKNHYKLWTIISLLFVFATGLVSGIVVDKYLFNKKPTRLADRSNRQRTNTTHYPTLDIIGEELGLSAEQKEKIREIFKNNEERFKLLRKNMNDGLRDMRTQLMEEINNVLTEEQQAKYKAMIAKYRSQRSRESDKRKTQSKEQNKGDTR